jgi:hypothetical protein
MYLYVMPGDDPIIKAYRKAFALFFDYRDGADVAGAPATAGSVRLQTNM